MKYKSFYLWTVKNSNLMVISLILIFISSALSAFSLVLIQGVFGKESNDVVGYLSTTLISKLGSSWSILIAIISWSSYSILFREINEFLVNRRFKDILQSIPSSDSSIKRKNKSAIRQLQFSKSILDYLGAILMTLFFVTTLFLVSTLIVNIILITSLIFTIILCIHRYQEGWILADGQIETNQSGSEDNTSKSVTNQLQFYIERTNSFIRIKNHQIILFIGLVMTPWILNGVGFIKVLESMSFFGFTALLMFYASAFRIVIQSAVIGYRFRMYLDATDI